MMQNASFVRKIIYIFFIGFLLIPLSFIARPSTRKKDNSIDNAGGKLAQLRDENRLSQATLGDIDPASESMKLATLGLRPFAVSMLWNKVNEYKKMHNWDQLTATLNQLMKIQPNFVTVWEFQAHTLAYNTSREFDDYEDRYTWVKKGINFLITGIGYNRYDHRMIDNIGRYFSLKVGHSDEKLQFRRLLRKDKDFHDHLRKEVSVDEANKRKDGPDNWLIARLWYKRSEKMVEVQKLPMRTASEVIFYMNAPKQTRNYAKDLEVEFEPDEFAMEAWKVASKDWNDFGAKPMKSTGGLLLKLNNAVKESVEMGELNTRLDEIVPGVRERIKAERLAMRTPEEQAALDAGPEKATSEQAGLGIGVRNREAIHHREISEEASEANRAEAERIANELDRRLAVLDMIHKYRGIANYPYWELRCTAESTPSAIEARNNLFHARRLQSIRPYDETRKDESGETVLDKDGKPVMSLGALTYYERCFAAFAKMFEENPTPAGDSFKLDIEAYNDDIEDACNAYLKLLNGPEAWPTDFPLQYLIDVQPRRTALPKTEQLKLLHPEINFSGKKTEPDESSDEKADDQAEGKTGAAPAKKDQVEAKSEITDSPAESEAAQPKEDATGKVEPAG